MCAYVRVCVCMHYMYSPVLVVGTTVVEVIDPRDVTLFEDFIIGQIEGFVFSDFMELSTVTIVNINYMLLMMSQYSTWYNTGVKWNHCIVIY